MKISVVIPVFNSYVVLEALLLRLIEDISTDDEIVVVNDGSEDFSSICYENLGKIDARIQVFSRPHLGIVSALNFGIQNAKHELIARMDVDDFSVPGRFDIQRSLFETNEKLVLVFTDYEIYSANHSYLGYMPCGISDFGTKLSLINPSRTAHPSAVFRKEAFVKALGYRTQDFPAEDLGLWLRFIPLGEFAGVPVPLLRYIISPQGISSNKRHQMVSRSKALRFEICNKIQFDLSSTKQAMEAYMEASYSFERKILLARDLFSLMIFQRRFNLSSFLIILQILLKREAISVLLNLFYWQMRRRAHRTYLNIYKRIQC